MLIGCKQKGYNYDILLSIFILTMLNHGATLDVLTEIWGVDKIWSPNFRNDEIAKEIVDFNRYGIRVRSTVIAKYILKSCSDAGTIVTILSRIAKQIEKGKNVSKRYSDILKSLMRFSSIQEILPERQKRAAIIRYYEEIKNLLTCKDNPLFWLQYAIASLVMEDLYRSKMYFDTAYSLAKKKNWDLFQIDNHYSRYLLEKAKKDLDYKDALQKLL